MRPGVGSHGHLLYIATNTAGTDTPNTAPGGGSILATVSADGYKGTSPTPAPEELSEALRYSLLRLGIILLELCFGHALEEHPRYKKEQQVPGSCGARRTNTPKSADFNDNDSTSTNDEEREEMAARHWQRSVYGEAGPDYGRAVQACISGDLDVRYPRAADFLLAVHDDVVQPLERAVRLFEGRAPNDPLAAAARRHQRKTNVCRDASHVSTPYGRSGRPWDPAPPHPDVDSDGAFGFRPAPRPAVLSSAPEVEEERAAPSSQMLRRPRVPLGLRLELGHRVTLCLREFDQLEKGLQSAPPTVQQSMPARSLLDDERGRLLIWANSAGLQLGYDQKFWVNKTYNDVNTVQQAIAVLNELRDALAAVLSIVPRFPPNRSQPSPLPRRCSLPSNP